MDMTADRGKMLLAGFSQIERSFGKNVIMRMGQRKAEAVPVILSRSLALDVALGNGGYPRGGIVEFYGSESSAKSMLALHAVVGAQRTGGTAFYIDAEHALDSKYPRALGVDVDAMLLSQQDGGEQAFEIMDTMAASGAVDIVVMRKLTETMAQAGALVIFIHQICCLAKDGLILTIEGLKENRDVHRGDRIQGERGWTKVVEIHHGEMEEEIVEKAGSWYSYDSQRLGPGVTQAKAFFEANLATVGAIVTRICDCRASVTEG